MNKNISHYTVYPVAPLPANSGTIIPESGSVGEHSKATRASVVFTTEMAPLDGRSKPMFTNKKRHHSITAINEQLQNPAREQKQCDSQLQVAEPPPSEKRRWQPSRATKTAAESNIRHNAITGAHPSIPMEVDGEYNPSTHISRWLPEDSSDDSDGEFRLDKSTHTTVWDRRRMIANRVGRGYDNHASTSPSITEPEDRRLASARLARLRLGIRESLTEPSGHLIIQQMNATADQLTNPDRLGSSPMAFEAGPVDAAAMDVDQQPDPVAYLSDDSSDLSTVDSMDEARPFSLTSTGPPEAVTVKIERLSAIPETSISRHALVEDPEKPLPDAAINIGQRDDNGDPAATANSGKDFTPQSIVASTPVALNSGQPSPEVISVTKEMAAARASRPSLPKRPSPQVHPGPLPDASIDLRQRDDIADPGATANCGENKLQQSIFPSISVVLNPSPSSEEMLSVTKEMAAARASRPSLPKRPSPQVHPGPLPPQALAEMQTGATDDNTDKIRETQSEPVSHPALQESSAQREVRSLSERDVVDHMASVHPQVLEGVVDYRPTGGLKARHVSHDTAPPSVIGPSWSEEAPQAVPRLAYLKFRLMTTTSDADLAEFIHLIRAHAGCTDTDFLDCVKRYLTKKDVLRKLEQRPDYLDLILDQATAPSTAIALHQALVHALKTLDTERSTVQHLAGRIHDLDDEFSIKYPRPAETGKDALASRKNPMLEAQLVADNGNSDSQDGPVPAYQAAVLGDEGLSKMASSVDAGPTEPSKATPRPEKEKDTKRNESSATVDTVDSGKCPHQASASDQVAEQGPANRHLGATPQNSRSTATINTVHGCSVPTRVAGIPNDRSIAALTPTGDGKYTLMMRSRLREREMGQDEIYPRCDRCRRQDLKCISFRIRDQRPRIRCLGCNDSRSNCTWFDVTSEEIKWLNKSRQDKPKEGATVEASITASEDATSSGDDLRNNDKKGRPTSVAPASPAPPLATRNEEHQDPSTHSLRPNPPDSDKDYTAEMKKRASKLKRFEEIPLRCDRCRKHGWSCAAYTGKCFDCFRNGKSCTWTNLNAEEIRSLNDTVTDDEDEVEVLKEVIILD